MSDSKQSVLITGANGFIGSRLCAHFIQNGFHVIAGVRKNANCNLLNNLSIEYRYADITKRESLDNFVSGVDYIVHNAGIVKAKIYQHFYDVNKTGTENLFDAILRANSSVKKVTLISSLAVAGPSKNSSPITEYDKPAPVTTYGKSKAAAELIALSFDEKLPVVVIRPPGVYGPGDKELFSLFQTVNNRLRPYIGKTSRKIHLVHVDDLCRGVVMATSASVVSGSIYFIAEKRSYSLKEMIDLFASESGQSTIPVYIPAPIFKFIAKISEIIFRLVGATPMLTKEKTNELLASWEVSTEKAKNDLGYESTVSLRDGVRDTYAWYHQQGWL